MKKLLSFLLAFMLIISAVPLGTFTLTASADSYIEDYYTYEVNEYGEATITDVDDSISGDIIIPSKFGVYPVTSIGNAVFYYCSSLTSITIPDSVTSIGDRSFGIAQDLQVLPSLTVLQV